MPRPSTYDRMNRQLRGQLRAFLLARDGKMSHDDIAWELRERTGERVSGETVRTWILREKKEQQRED